jgi:hypothetical protein
MVLHVGLNHISDAPFASFFRTDVVASVEYFSSGISGTACKTNFAKYGEIR